MPLDIEQSGHLDRCHRSLHSQTLKDRATQLLIKYKSGALVTQIFKEIHVFLWKQKSKECKIQRFASS